MARRVHHDKIGRLNRVRYEVVGGSTMSEHELKEALQKSSHKPRASEQAAPTTAEGSGNDLIRLQ